VELQGSVPVATGGASGVGRATALAAPTSRCLGREVMMFKTRTKRLFLYTLAGCHRPSRTVSASMHGSKAKVHSPAATRVARRVQLFGQLRVSAGNQVDVARIGLVHPITGGRRGGPC
jgi:hypothetical protein